MWIWNIIMMRYSSERISLFDDYEVLWGASKPTNCKISDENKPYKFWFFAKRIIHHFMKKSTINAYNTKTNRDVLKFKTYYWLIRCLILLSSKFVGLPKELFVLSCL